MHTGHQCTITSKIRHLLAEQDISNSRKAHSQPEHVDSYCKSLNLIPPDIDKFNNAPMFEALFKDDDMNCKDGLNSNCCLDLVNELRRISNADEGACEQGPMIHGRRKFSSLAIVSIVTATVAILSIFIMIGHFGTLRALSPDFRDGSDSAPG